MRHKNSGRRLGRKSPHRRAMYRNRVRLGLEAAFLKIGSRIVVDEAAYLAAARKSGGGRPGAA